MDLLPKTVPCTYTLCFPLWGHFYGLVCPSLHCGARHVDGHYEDLPLFLSLNAALALLRSY